MRVAILSPYPAFLFADELGYTGASRENNATWTMVLARHLAMLPDTEVHIVTEATGISRSKTINDHEVAVHFIKAPQRYKTLTLWQLDRLRLHRALEAIRPDIVHGQGIEHQYGYVAVTAPYPHLLTIHGIPYVSNLAAGVRRTSPARLLELLSDYTLKRAHNLVVINPYVAQTLALTPERHRLFFIPNAINPDLFLPSETPRETDLLLTIGTVYPRKAHDKLARAMAILKQRGVRLRAVIAGPIVESSYTQELRRYIREQQLDIEITGFIPLEDLQRLQRRCTLLVHTSRNESFGMVIAEAMAAGTPVIAARAGSVPYVVEDGKTGVLFEPDNCEELADRIEELLADAPARQRLADSARLAAAAYLPDQIARQTRAAYETILENRPGNHPATPPEPPSLIGRLKQNPALRATARRALSLVPLARRLGPEFWENYNFFEASQYWPHEQLADYQMQQLRKLLQELARTSEFYRRRLAGIDIEKLASLADFQAALPTLSRDEFRQNYAAIRSNEWSRQAVMKVQTSGTTGASAQFLFTRSSNRREWAAICHQWKRVGYEPGRSRRVEFRGLTTGGRLVEDCPDQNMFRCSILHLKEEHVRYYAEQIRARRGEFFHGYPSALYLLAQQIVEHRLDFPQPQALLLASEEVYDWQLARMEEAFPYAKIFAHYGCAERTVLAGWCEHRREYHVMPQYALVEVDPVNSEIIGTNLYNTVNGFVRYRTTDTVLRAEMTPCPDCGRAYLPRLIQLGGRSEDYLYSPERGWISPAIVTYALKSLTAIQEVQIVQDAPHTLRIRYRSGLAPSDARITAEQANIQRDLLHLLGREMRLQFEATDYFPRGVTGKFKWIISRIDEQHAQLNVPLAPSSP